MCRKDDIRAELSDSFPCGITVAGQVPVWVDAASIHTFAAMIAKLDGPRVLARREGPFPSLVRGERQMFTGGGREV